MRIAPLLSGMPANLSVSENSVQGGLMEHQSKLDADATAAIAIMVPGTSPLTVNSLGVPMIAAGVAMMPALFLAAVRKNK
ncbi:MAG: hypothetical protein ABIR51_06325 [Sphingomicrobium sp.]